MKNYINIFALLCFAACAEPVEKMDVIEVQHELLPADTTRSKLSENGTICGATPDAEFMIVRDKLILETISLPPEWETMKIQNCD